MRRRLDNAAVLVFARSPQPGQVKTRLVPALGNRGASELYRRMAERSLIAAAGSGAAVQLWCAGETADPWLVTMATRYAASLHQQTTGDLGLRMHHALCTALQNHTAAVLIGTDCPMLHRRLLRHAVASLEAGADAVFVPAFDGGYVLVGLRRPCAALFQSIGWGGPSVMAESRSVLHGLGWNWQELPPLWDVDEPADLRRLQRYRRFARWLAYDAEQVDMA